MPYKGFSAEVRDGAIEFDFFHLKKGKTWANIGMSEDDYVDALAIHCTPDDTLRVHGSLIPLENCILDETGNVQHVPQDELLRDEDLWTEVTAGEPVPIIRMTSTEDETRTLYVIEHAQPDSVELVALNALLNRAAINVVQSLN